MCLHVTDRKIFNSSSPNSRRIFRPSITYHNRQNSEVDTFNRLSYPIIPLTLALISKSNVLKNNNSSRVFEGNNKL